MARYLVAAAALLLSACSGDTTEPRPNADGTYCLRTWAGQPLPQTAGGQTLESGRITISRGEYTDETRGRLGTRPVTATATGSPSGTLVFRNGGAIDFYGSASEFPVDGLLRRDTLTIQQGNAFVYVRSTQPCF